MENSDIRMQILDRLKIASLGTKEFVANGFLHSICPTDLGTIKRALLDLLEDGYIKESNLRYPEDLDRSVVNNIDAHGPGGAERLLDSNDIASIRLYITLKGMKFLTEVDNLKRTTWNLRYDLVIKVALIVVGALITLAISYFARNGLIPSAGYQHPRPSQCVH